MSKHLDLFEHQRIRIYLKMVGEKEEGDQVTRESVAFEGIFMGHDSEFMYIGEKLDEEHYMLRAAFRKQEVVFISIITDLGPDDAPIPSGGSSTGHNGVLN